MRLNNLANKHGNIGWENIAYSHGSTVCPCQYCVQCYM